MAKRYCPDAEYAALAERCERLEAALREVMQPYGMYDKAVHNSFGLGQDYMLDAGNKIRELLQERNGGKE